MDEISLRRPTGELERWAGTMVVWFKPEILRLPVISIQGGFRLALGWFAWSRWESRDGAILNEINFVPEHLGRDVFDIAETLVHELVHLANYVADIRDCSSNQYHNRHFRDRAMSVGLACERVPLHGWAKTSLTPALRERIALLKPDASAFDLFRLPPAPQRPKSGVAVTSGSEAAGVAVVQTRKAKKLTKWTCSGNCAPAWVASGKRMWATCHVCGSDYYRADSIESADDGNAGLAD
jgi:hypothetical protein